MSIILTVGVDGAGKKCDAGGEEHTRDGPCTSLLEGRQGGESQGVQELILSRGTPLTPSLVSLFRQAVGSVGAFIGTTEGIKYRMLLMHVGRGVSFGLTLYIRR